VSNTTLVTRWPHGGHASGHTRTHTHTVHAGQSQSDGCLVGRSSVNVTHRNLEQQSTWAEPCAPRDVRGTSVNSDLCSHTKQTGGIGLRPSCSWRARVSVPCSSAIFSIFAKFRHCSARTLGVDQHTHTCLSVLPPRVVLGSHTQTALSNVSDMASCTSCATSAGHVFVRECQKTWPDWATNAGCFMRCMHAVHAVLARPTQHARERGSGSSTRACTPPAIWPLSFGVHCHQVAFASTMYFLCRWVLWLADPVLQRSANL